MINIADKTDMSNIKEFIETEHKKNPIPNHLFLWPSSSDFVVTNTRKTFYYTEDIIVGVASIIEKSELVYLDYIIVSKNHYRLGIGKKLLESLVQYAKVNKKRKIECKVSPYNFSALNLYKNFGFKIKQHLDDFHGVERLEMVLNL